MIPRNNNKINWCILAEKPEFNGQIQALSLMAPIAYLNNVQIIIDLTASIPRNPFAVIIWRPRSHHSMLKFLVKKK